MDVNNKQVGNRIKNLRSEKGMSQEEFGSLVNNAHKSLVSKWEKGQSLPNNERLKRIAELGNISINELLYGSLDSYIVSVLNNSAEINDDHNSIWLARNPLIFANKWNLENFPSEEEIIHAYKKYKNDLLDTKEENALLFGKEIYEMNIKRNKILENLEEFEKLPLDEKHKELDKVSRHLQKVFYWYRKHFGLTPEEAYEDYNELYSKKKKQ